MLTKHQGGSPEASCLRCLPALAKIRWAVGCHGSWQLQAWHCHRPSWLGKLPKASESSMVWPLFRWPPFWRHLKLKLRSPSLGWFQCWPWSITIYAALLCRKVMPFFLFWSLCAIYVNCWAGWDSSFHFHTFSGRPQARLPRLVYGVKPGSRRRIAVQNVPGVWRITSPSHRIHRIHRLGWPEGSGSEEQHRFSGPGVGRGSFSIEHHSITFTILDIFRSLHNSSGDRLE